jgi:hypothetical protein
MSTITALPTAPTRTDPNTFSARADAWDAALVLLGPEINVVAGEVNANAVSAVAAAAAALVSQDAASGSAAAAAASVATVGVAWVSGTTYAIGNIRYSPINFASYCRKTAGAGTTDPSLDSTNWAPSVIVAGTGGTTLTGSVTLTVSSAAAMTITPATPGLYVTLPVATTCREGGMLYSIYNAGDYDYGVKDSAGTQLGWVRPRTGAIIGLADNSTAAGTWAPYGLEKTGITAQYSNHSATNTNASGLQAVELDSDRTCFLFGGTTCWAVVYDASTQTWGTATSVRTGLGNRSYFGILAATDLVLVASCDTTTGFEAVTLSIASNAITVNTGTKASVTLGTNMVAGELRGIAVSTSLVFGHARSGNTPSLRAITVSGTTPSIGGEYNLIPLDSTAPNLFASGSVLRTVCASTSSINCRPYTVSGTALTAGTAASATTSASEFRAFVNGNGNIVANYKNSNHSATIFTLTGTTEAASTAVLSTTEPGTITTVTDYVAVSASKTAFISNVAATAHYANILTDTAGTASVGTELTFDIAANADAVAGLGAESNAARFAISHSSNGRSQIALDCSGSSPALSSIVRHGSSTSFDAVVTASNKRGERNGNRLVAGTASYTFGSGTQAFGGVYLPGRIARFMPTQVAANGVLGASSSESNFTGSIAPSGTTGIVIQRVEAAA